MAERNRNKRPDPKKAASRKKAGEIALSGQPTIRQTTVRKKLLFATVVLVAFFALAELVLWLMGVATLIEREDPFRGFSGIVTVFERDDDVFRTRPAAVKHTFNDQSFLVEKPDGGIRVFCLGGSSSYGFPWGAEAAFTSILGELLAASHPELHVEAVNVSGLSYAMHRLNIVADELLAYEPDVFIVYSGHNEFIEPAFFEALKHRSAVRTRLEYLLSHSRVYSGMRAAFEHLTEEKPSAGCDFGMPVQRDETRVFSRQEKEAIVAEYRWRLERLVRRAQEQGIKVVLATVPANLRQWRPQASTGLSALTNDDSQKWSELVASAKRRLDAGDFEAATADLQQAARLAPDHAETQFLLGQAHEKLGRFDEARTAYQRACDADASPIRRVSGVNEAVREVARQRDTLLVDVDRIFERRSEHGLVGFNLIEDYVHPTRAGHELITWHLWDAMERAGWFGSKTAANRELFDQVVAERHRRPVKKNAVWFYNQGVVLQNQGHAQAAIEKYREALAIMPDHEGAMHNLGALLSDTGQDAEAVGLLERLVELNPNGGEAHYSLGNALQNLGRLEEAVTHYQEALRLRPEFPDVHNNWGIALHKLGRFEEAVTHYQEALRLRPDGPDAHNNLGIALQRLGRLEEAMTHFQEALRLRPDDAAAHNTWGLTLQGLGRFEEAAAHYREALRLKPDYAPAYHHLGDLFTKQGDLSRAEAQFRNAIRLQPDYSAAYYGLGTALYRQGETGEAVRQLEEGLRARPDDLALHSALAAICRERGDVPKEMLHLQEIVRRDPSNLPAAGNLAWILATSDDDGLRNGKQALELAQRCARAADYEQAGTLDTLAAAFAETGNFAEAVRWQTKAVELAPLPEKAALRSRLELYKAGKPFRQQSAASPAASTSPAKTKTEP